MRAAFFQHVAGVPVRLPRLLHLHRPLNFHFQPRGSARKRNTRGVPTAWSPLARRLFSLSVPDKPPPPTATRKVTFAASPRSPWLLPIAAMCYYVLDFFSSLLLPPRARLVTPGELGNAHPSNSTGLRRSSSPRHWLPRRRARPCELSLKVVAKARRSYWARVSPVASCVSSFAQTFVFCFFFAGQVSPTDHRFGSAPRTVTVPRRHTRTR